ncbi:MAG: GAF domain-containing protein [Bacteroidales bacterium]|nr:GAF domain-containing protein [Bacteroidales bacterium]
MISILLLSASFWNQGSNNGVHFSAWPFIFLPIALACVGYLYILTGKLIDPRLIQKQVQDQLDVEKAKIMAESESKVEEVINKNEDLEEMLNKIIPTGRFKDANAFAQKLLVQLSNEIQGSLGAVYLQQGNEFKFVSGFALTGETEPAGFKAGENLNGQAAASQEVMIIRDIPETYFTIESGLGKAKPETLIIIPIIHKKSSIGIIEIATFIKDDMEYWTELFNKIGLSSGEKIVQIQKSK